MSDRSVRLMGRTNRSGELLIRMRAGERVPLKETNPYVREACADRELVLTAVELAAEFPRIFGAPDRPVWADLGCYLGETVAAMAAANREVNFLGVDMRYKRVVKSARRVRRENVPNVRIVLCDAGVFLDSLPPASLAGISVFFPDPWPRRKQRKHRFVNPEFLEKAVSRLRPRGVLWFKTDQEDYFAEVAARAPEHGLAAGPVPPGALRGIDYDSFFQRLFARRAERIFQAAWIKES